VATPVRYMPSAWARFWRPSSVALDLGTDAFRLAYAGTRSLMEIPARAVLDARGHVAAIGKRALHMEERLPENWRAVLPVEVGHLSHPQSARQLVRLLLRQLQRRRLWKPRLCLATPVGMTPMERTVLASFLRELPVREFHYGDGAVAQCVGAGLSPAGVPGMIVVDIGAQRTCVTVLSFGKAVLTDHRAGGGHAWTTALKGAIEDAHRVRVPRLCVEEWKRSGGDGRLPAQDRLTGRLHTLELPAAFAAGAMEHATRALLDHLTTVFTRCPPALRMDIQERGVLVVGNGGRVPGLRDRLEADLGLPITVPDDPGRALVRGLARMARLGDIRQRVGTDAVQEPPVDLFPLEA
jgi:rod shape-determining protein MreB